jgi:predicted RNA-binding Zn-ribbon protein involved in translation (DUF1610 family)
MNLLSLNFKHTKMGKKNGIEIIYEPTEKKVELDDSSIKAISEKLNTFLDEQPQEKLKEILRGGNARHMMAKYNCNGSGFQGGPSFVLEHNPDNNEETHWDLFIAQGSYRFVEMKLDRKGEIKNIHHDFNEKAYRTEIILGWFDSVFSSIKAAQERQAFKWEITY